LLVVTTPKTLDPPGSACPLYHGLSRGYHNLNVDPNGALDDLLDEVPGLDRSAQEAQLAALTQARAFSPGLGPPFEAREGTASFDLYKQNIRAWGTWAIKNQLISDRHQVLSGFTEDGPPASCPGPSD
jgi:hypothetical protein